MRLSRQQRNAKVIEQELAWFQEVMQRRFAVHMQTAEAGDVQTVLGQPPVIHKGDGPYAGFVHDLKLNAPERLVLVMALVPHLAPEMLDPFLLQNQATGRRFSEFGGILGQSHVGLLPTAETALFLLAGNDRGERMTHRAIFAPSHRLLCQGVLVIDHRHADEPPLSGGLRLSREYLERLLTGEEYVPGPGDEFPAERISTLLDWEDLVLDSATRQQVDMIGRWVRHSETLLDDWELAKRLRPGYRSLFHGGPGTGKTLTACLLGKRHGVPVYRVDLSRVVSKWIGETEKNLAALFDTAQHRNWILFFDEAEALFGKRTESRSANDRSANQQIAYLLQRLEDFPGLVILATNQRAHMDEAFTRRFQSSIPFPMPDTAARRRLWQDIFRAKHLRLAEDIDFDDLASRYELAGGAIVNILRHACLLAVERDPPMAAAADIMSGIKLELMKTGHYVSR